MDYTLQVCSKGNVCTPLYSTVPDAVDEILPIPFGITCIGINWTAPASLDSRGDTTSFFVVVTDMSSSNTTNNGDNNEKIFMDLAPGVGYDFKVRKNCTCTCMCFYLYFHVYVSTTYNADHRGMKEPQRSSCVTCVITKLQL